MTRLRGLWVALGLMGLCLLIPFDAPVTLAAGVLCLVGFVAVGVALIATPAFTGEDKPREPAQDANPRSRPRTQ